MKDLITTVAAITILMVFVMQFSANQVIMGRILAAVGYAGVDVPVDNIDIYLADIPVMLASSPVDFDEEDVH